MCDAAGSLEIDFELASFQVGVAVSTQDLAAFGERIVCLPSGRHWITGFIDYQYSNLSKDCKAHGPVFKAIAERDIPYGIGYTKGMDTLKDKDKDISLSVNIGVVSDPPPIPEHPHHALAVPLADEFRIELQKSNTDVRVDREWKIAAVADMEQMLGTDRRTVDEIRKKMALVFKDRFWGDKAVTVGKFREYWNAGKLSNLGKVDVNDRFGERGWYYDSKLSSRVYRDGTTKYIP